MVYGGILHLQHLLTIDYEVIQIVYMRRPPHL